MEKVKTLIESLNEGYEKAFYNLDKRVEEIGKIKIMDIKDTVYPEGSSLNVSEQSYIERIVIYKEDRKIDGEPWRPTLDTDLMDFIKASDPPNDVYALIEETYTHGKKSIRDLIAMPYAWISNVWKTAGFRRTKKVDVWIQLQRELNKYGIKLYKKGYVVKD